MLLSRVPKLSVEGVQFPCCGFLFINTNETCFKGIIDLCSMAEVVQWPEVEQHKQVKFLLFL